MKYLLILILLVGCTSKEEKKKAADMAAATVDARTIHQLKGLNRKPDQSSLNVMQREGPDVIEGCTMPWGIAVDKEGKFWWNSNYPVDKKWGGTCSEVIRVNRVKKCFELVRQTKQYSVRDSDWHDMPECKD